MAKKGQHHNDADDKQVSKGHNHPDKSQTITTGTYKKPETYRQQAAEHRDTSDHQPQVDKNAWNDDTRDKPGIGGSPRARDSDITSGRSGSDSDQSKSTRGG